jgi:DNA-binding response OmpR family regulator
MHHGRLDAGAGMIGKPFTFEELAARIRAILDHRQLSSLRQPHYSDLPMSLL